MDKQGGHVDQATLDYQALNDLIVNCPELDELAEKLGGFNIFQVLKAEYGEIRHSNVLAWLSSPHESHGLSDDFLKKWLKRVVHENPLERPLEFDVIDIECWNLYEVEVRREWNGIDILLVLKFIDQDEPPWVVCIENKVKSTQHTGQLAKYRARVEDHFPGHKKLFVLLCKDLEQPEDKAYTVSSYDQVHAALKSALDARSHSVGEEPKLLIANYLRLLEERFMDNSQIADLARKIYTRHKKALDIIFEHRPDSVRILTDCITDLLAKDSGRLGIRLESSTKGSVKFIPTEWDQPGNTHGAAWSKCNRTVLFELTVRDGKAYLWAISGKAPGPWIDPLWQVAMESPSFQKTKSGLKRPSMWCTLHTTKGARPQYDPDSDTRDQIEADAKAIYEWAVRFLQDSNTREVIRVVAEYLPELDKLLGGNPERMVDSE